MTIARHMAFGRLTRVLELDQVCPVPGLVGENTDLAPINYQERSATLPVATRS